MSKKTAKNILGENLTPCSTDPITGFYRDGCCNTGAEDIGFHTVCVAISDAFLAYTQSFGNDLSTPQLAHGFPGLKAGDRWCLCASRWLQAHQAGCALRGHVQSTHEAALRIIPLELMTAMAADLN
jgi:uncharacterized protein (DUF2237 family)